MPLEISFWEVAFRVTQFGKISVVAWTVDVDGQREFEMNPKDKFSRRPWNAEDRIAVIRRLV